MDGMMTDCLPWSPLPSNRCQGGNHRQGNRKQLANPQVADARLVTNTRRCSYTSYNLLTFTGMKGAKFAAIEDTRDVGGVTARRLNSKRSQVKRDRKQVRGRNGSALVAVPNKAEDSSTSIMRGINKTCLAISDVCANSPVSTTEGHRRWEVLLARLSNSRRSPSTFQGEPGIPAPVEGSPKHTQEGLTWGQPCACLKAT